MEVFTMNDPGADGERVRQAVKVMTELLAADHLKPAPHPELAKELAPFNELGQMAERCGAERLAFPSSTCSPIRRRRRAAARGPARLDASSPVFLVDHSACILCDRCVRACDEVRKTTSSAAPAKGATAASGST